MIICKNIQFVYDSRLGKKNSFRLTCENFEAPAKSVTFILGRNGSGKTTFLKLLGGFEKPSSGTISLNGEDRIPRSKIGWIDVRAAENLVGELTVVDHLALGLVDFDPNLSWFPRNAFDDYYKLKLSHLGELQKETVTLLRERVSELSRGQKQLLSIALAVMTERAVLLADESTANLDAKNARLFFDALTDLAEKHSIAVVVVTHDLLLAAEFGKHFYSLCNGKVLELTAPPERDARIQAFRSALDAGGNTAL